MKILLTCFFPILNGIIDGGGISTYILLLKKKLEDMGHHVDLFGVTLDTSDYFIPSIGGYLNKEKIIHFVSDKLNKYYDKNYPQVDSFVKYLEINKYCFELAAAYCDLGSYDIINAQDVISSRAMWRVKPKHVPLITTIHGVIPYELQLRGIFTREGNPSLWNYLFLQEQLGASSNNITLVTSYWTKNMLLSEFGVAPDHIAIVPNGLDINQFINRMHESSSIVRPDNKFIFVCVARLAKEKGITYLIEALSMLRKDRRDWECWIVGDGPDRFELEHQVRSAQLDKMIYFLGHRDDVPAILKHSDILVLPSLQENCPYVVMEAHVAGLAVVATSAGGLPEMITHEETGLLNESGKSEPLYRNLKRVLEDNLLRIKIAENAKHWGTQYWSLDKRIEEILKYYEHAIYSNANTMSISSVKSKPKKAIRKSVIARKRSKSKTRLIKKKRKNKILKKKSNGQNKKNKRKFVKTNRRQRYKKAKKKKIIPSAISQKPQEELISSHSFNYLFSFDVESQELMLDPSIWNVIKDKLPTNYSIPDQAFHNLF